MNITVIDSYSSFAALEKNWDELYSKDQYATFFMSWKWYSKLFMQFPDEWTLLAARATADDSDFIAFFPIRLETKWSKSRHCFRNEIHTAGTRFWGQYTGFVCHPEWETSAITAFGKYLTGMHWSRISLKFLHASDSSIIAFTEAFSDSPLRISFHKQMINQGKDDRFACPYIELPDDYETYLDEGVSANTRQKMRRYSRKIENSEVLHFTMTDQYTLQRDLDILVDLWVKRWSHKKGSQTDYVVNRYRQIVEQYFQCGAVYMPILWRGDEPLAIHAYIVDWVKKSVFFMVGARNELKGDNFVGTAMHAHGIRWAIENGHQIYDFCHGDETYKLSYTSTIRYVKQLVIRTDSGMNLNKYLDPKCFDDVITGVIEFLDDGKMIEARTACKQIKRTSRHYKNLKHAKSLIQADMQITDQ